ncbi:MAG: TIGR02679 family protein [Lachnospiraceae bacterium]|nr:TIGR02679 family protein [Lachnospiraceae bacterium]
MNKGRECAAYFRSRNEWKRFFELLRKKWESLGKTGGRITLEDSTPEERQAMEKMMGKVYADPKVVISLTSFEEMLQKTRFAPVTLHELLEAYFGREIRSNQDRKQEKKEIRDRFFSSCKAYFQKRQEAEKQDVLDWISHMEDKQCGGYAVLLRELKAEEETARNMLCVVGDALISALQNGEDIPIAVLAAQVSGNPHYLDRGSVPGNLFMQGLCSAKDRAYPKCSSEWKERLLETHILPDDISSMVTTLGVHLQIEDQVHPAVEEFCNRKEPVVLTALNLRKATAAWTETKRVYIVENEMVFTYLADRACEDKVALMCTSGQMRNAALEIIDLLADSDTQIYYSGDMDPEGMGIADRLWQRFPENVHIWRMSPKEYQKAISNEEIDKRSLTMLNSLKNRELQDTARHILQKKCAAYQENILTELSRDILEKR